MRTLFAWALLLCICWQWMAGSYYLKTEYAVRIGHVMNAEEATIGADVARELGLVVKVRLLDEADVARLALGYNGFFPFSHEVDGEKVYYTLERDSLKIVDHLAKLNRLPDPDAPVPTVPDWQRFFPQFRDRIATVSPVSTLNRALPVCNFAYLAWPSRPEMAPPVPPPELLG